MTRVIYCQSDVLIFLHHTEDYQESLKFKIMKSDEAISEETFFKLLQTWKWLIQAERENKTKGREQEGSVLSSWAF